MNNSTFEELIVVKRSGQRVAFNGPKIAIAIKHAFDSVYEKSNEKDINRVYADVLDFINKNYNNRKTINVEDIQDIIENILKEDKYLTVYNAFNEYRTRRAASRKVFSVKQQHKFVKVIEKIANDDSLKNENNFKPIDTLLRFGKTISSEFAKAYFLDTKFVRSHEEGFIHINNLDYLTLGVFRNVNLKCNSNQLIEDPFNFIETLIKCKEEVNGEIQISKYDYLLEPVLLNKFKESLKEYIVDSLEITGFIDYINETKIEKIIDSFNTINITSQNFEFFIMNDLVRELFDKCITKALIKTNKYLVKITDKIIGNLAKTDRTYSFSFGTNNSYEGSLINNCLLNQIAMYERYKNVILIFKVNKDMNDELLYKVSELIIDNKNIVLSFVNSSINKNGLEEVEYFGSGLRIYENVVSNDKESIGRMTIATTSINMARLALRNMGKPIKDFYQELDETLEIIKNELLLVFETIGNKNKDNYKYLFNGNILDDEKLEDNQKIRKVLKNGNLSICIIGLKECANALGKKDNIVLDILKYVANKINKMATETKLNFSMTEICSEKTIGELITLDKTIYGSVVGITDKHLYQSLYTMYELKDNLLFDLKAITEYQKYFNGGFNLEINLSKKTNVSKLKDIIKLINDCDIGFAKITVGKKGDSS